MNYATIFLIVILFFVTSYGGHRLWLSMIIDARIRSRSARKKIKKGQSFKEWFFYTRFRDVLPKFPLYVNIGMVFYFVIALLVFLVLMALKVKYESALYICIIHLIPYFVLGFISWIQDLIRINPKYKESIKQVEFWYGSGNSKKKK